MPNLSKGGNFLRSGWFEVMLFQYSSMFQTSLTSLELVKQGIKMLEVAEEQKMFHLFLFFLYNVDKHFKRFTKESIKSIPHGSINIKCVSRKGRPFFSVTSPVQPTSLAPSAVLQASGYSRFSSSMDWAPAWWVAVWAWQNLKKPKCWKKIQQMKEVKEIRISDLDNTTQGGSGPKRWKSLSISVKGRSWAYRRFSETQRCPCMVCNLNRNRY